jgi:hypothetical protein
MGPILTEFFDYNRISVRGHDFFAAFEACLSGVKPVLIDDSAFPARRRLARRSSSDRGFLEVQIAGVELTHLGQTLPIFDDKYAVLKVHRARATEFLKSAVDHLDFHGLLDRKSACYSPLRIGPM